MPSSLYQRVGGAELPLDVADVTTAYSFKIADPALAVLADLFAAAIRGELGTGTSSTWYAVTSRLPSGHRCYQSTNPVGTIWTVEPHAALMKQVKVGSWPLLTVWRDGPAEWEQRTTVIEMVRQRFGVMWCFSDYEADLTLKLSPVLGYVGRILGLTAIAGRHPGYESDTAQFGEDRGWLSRLSPVSYDAGAVKFIDDEDSRFWSASAVFESEELVRDLDEGADNGTSFGLTENVGDQLELLPGLVIGDGDYPGS